METVKSELIALENWGSAKGQRGTPNNRVTSEKTQLRSLRKKGRQKIALSLDWNKTAEKEGVGDARE